jgi:predicted secreted protein
MANHASALIRSLNRLFWSMTAVAVTEVAAGYCLHRLRIEVHPPFGGLRGWGLLFLIAAVALGVAGPILIRTLFNRNAVTRKQVETAGFARYQRTLVGVATAAALIGGLAYILVVPKLYLYGSVLAGLYGIYGAIPNERKIAGEMRFYGLEGK